MSIPREAYKALESIVGPEYISEDPAITQAYSYINYIGLWENVGIKLHRPAAVILPSTTEEVQAIIKVCNRYKIPFVPIGSCLWPGAIPSVPNAVLIDPKRMDRILEIDEKNMYAVVEPYVTFAQLSAEAMKRGLFIPTPEAGSQVSVVANYSVFGMQGTAYRTGAGPRGALAIEWVLPTGEILRIGSASLPGSKYFCEEGPGPSLRGVLRGVIGHFGGLGMVTKMGVRLHPWPGPREFPCTGKWPLIGTEFPPDRFKIYAIRYPNLEKCIEAMYEIGKAEIGTVLQRWPTALWLFGHPAISKEGFWKEWETKYWQEKARYAIVIWLTGFSERQLKYEEKVLKEIVRETGGELVSKDEKMYKVLVPGLQGEWFRCGVSTRIFRPTGSYQIVELGIDSLDHAAKVIRSAEEAKKEFIEKGFFMDDAESDWICTYDFAHHAEGEIMFFYNVTKEGDKAGAAYIVKSIQEDIKRKQYAGLQMGPVHNVIGPAMFNYHLLLKKIKKTFDPNNISNPPYLIPPE